MKHIILLLVVFLSLTGWTFGQQLTFRMTKPVIYHSGGSPGTDYYRFDLEVKASVAGTYLWSGQAQFTFDNSTLSTTATDWAIFKGTLLLGTNEYSNPMYSTGKSLIGTGPYEFYCNWLGDNTARADFGGNPLDFNEVPTTWTQLAYIRVKVNSNTGVAGIDMNEAVFNGNESYLPSSSTTITPYANPNAFDSRDFLTLYVQRIFNGFDGWTGCGVSTSPSLAKASLSSLAHWTINANTSVWDTASAAAAITFSGSLANSLRIHLGARLAINADANLTCSGNTEINNPKGLWIVSSSTGTGSFIDNGTIIYNTGGNALVERYLATNKWHGYCLPFTSTSVIPYRGVYMKYWTESNHNYHYIIVPTPADSILSGAPFRGYMGWNPESRANTKVYPVGQLNTGFIQSIGATRTDMTQQYPGNGYNLLGNPYPSALDLSSTGVNWNLLDQKAWIWNPTGVGPDLGNYEVYIVAGGGSHSKYVPPEQGFFVHHVDASIGSTTLDLTNAARTHTLTENFMKDGLPDLISLKAYSLSNESEDIANVYFTPGATLGYDEFLDADKIIGGNAAPQLYSIITDRNLTVNAIPWTGSDQIVPLGFSCGVSGNYTITGSNIESFRLGTDVVLEDLKESKMQSLKQDSIYTFSYQKGESSSRFILHFSNPYYGVPGQDANAIHVYSFEEYVYVKISVMPTVQGTINIIDQLGRIVYSDKLENQPVNKFKPGLLQGYYVVTVKTDQFLINRKIYLK
jgi:hypothetical protein